MESIEKFMPIRQMSELTHPKANKPPDTSIREES